MCAVEHESPLCGNGTQESLLDSEIQFVQQSAEFVKAGVQLHAGSNASMLARASNISERNRQQDTRSLGQCRTGKY